MYALPFSFFGAIISVATAVPDIRKEMQRQVRYSPDRKRALMTNNLPPLRKNPSRETCETIIRRILMTEILEKGKNEHFKTAADFMSYFESLYPTSDALTKQVQRAIRSLNMPKDDGGYFIPNKTAEQLAQEQMLSHLLQKAEAALCPMENYLPLFLKVKPELISYLMYEIENSPAFSDKYLTMLGTSNGIIFYTDCPQKLKVLLDSLIVR